MTAKKPPEKLIALTGATGFVGGHILTAAVKAGHRVRALTRRPQHQRAGVEWVAGSLADEESLEALVAGADAVVHSAGIVKAGRTGDFFEVNARSVQRLAEIAAGSAPDGAHFVLISSLAARQPQLSPYAESKREGEELLAGGAADLPWTIIRPPAVYGPGDTEILKLLRVMKRGIAPVAGAGANTFSLIHGRDLAACTLAVVGHPGAYGRTVEPDDRKPAGYTMDEVAAAAAAVFGRAVRPVEVHGALLHSLALVNELGAALTGGAPMLSRHKVREMTHPDWVADPASHAAIPHWRPEITLAEGLRETIAWYRERGLL